MPEIGLYALRLGLAVAVVGIGAGAYGGIRKNPEWGAVAERSVYALFALLGVAMLALFYALGTNDFSLDYVAKHSARSMEWRYRLGALWGGQAGSLLLWVFLLMGSGTVGVATNRKKNRILIPWVAVSLLINAAFFLVLLNFLTNPNMTEVSRLQT